MKMPLNLLTPLVLIMTVFLSSCGYISDKAPANLNTFRADALQSCKVDVDKLAEIFKQDQKEQIRCLEENFNQFSKYVRSKDSRYVTEGELNTFVRKFFEGQSDAIAKGLSLIFQLNMLLLKDEADHISKTNISPLFNLLVNVNQEAINITQILNAMDDKKNQEHFFEFREKLKDSVARFSEFTLKIIESSPGLQQKLNIKSFLIDASKKIGANEFNPDTIDSLIFLKKILVAGDKGVITSAELGQIISKLPKLLPSIFDLYYARNNQAIIESDLNRLYLNDFREVFGAINFDQENFDLFSIDQILKLASTYFPNVDVLKFKPSFLALKNRLLGENGETFSFTDFKNIFLMGLDYVEKNYFNSMAYDFYQDDLSKNAPIQILKQLDLPQLNLLFSPGRIKELHQNFQDLAINYRYFRSKKDGVAFYGNDYSRNKSGFQEVSLLKWLSEKFIKSYGHISNQGQGQVSIFEFQNFLFDMKPILTELKLWSANPESFARNAVLLADLFQNKSNGDTEANINEVTEYFQMILAAVNTTDKFKENLSTVCDGGINKDEPVFETACFNQHFFDTFLGQFGKFFPRLADYANLNNTPKKDIDGYLSGVEGFARDNPDPLIPINKRDNILIIGALINVETFFIRFDANRDNIIDYNELLTAFKIYKPIVISVAHLKPADEVYALSIFLYMVSKMEIPATGSWSQSAMFYAFHKCVSIDLCRNSVMDKIEARRLNVGKLLYYIVNQAPKDLNKDKKLR